MPLADEGEIVVAARGVGDGRTPIDRDPDRGRVQAVATIDRRIGTDRVADADRVTGVATAVNVADRNGPAVGGRRCDAAISGRGDVGDTVIAKELVGEATLGRHLSQTAET